MIKNGQRMLNAQGFPRISKDSQGFQNIQKDSKDSKDWIPRTQNAKGTRRNS